MRCMTVFRVLVCSKRSHVFSCKNRSCVCSKTNRGVCFGADQLCQAAYDGDLVLIMGFALHAWEICIC